MTKKLIGLAAVLCVLGLPGAAAAQTTYKKADVDDLLVTVDATVKGNTAQHTNAKAAKAAAESAFAKAQQMYGDNEAELAKMDEASWVALNDALSAAANAGYNGDQWLAEGDGWRESGATYYAHGTTAYNAADWDAAGGYYNQAGADYYTSTYDYYWPAQYEYDASVAWSEQAVAMMEAYLNP